MANNYNPDVLNCIANLSNDEVFTPPTLANQVLDMLPQELFQSTKTTFLDPFTKSGVFLREIVKRLDRGLEAQIPDRQSRIDHILRNQVFGIAITELTSYLSRRSLYCSKTAAGKYSVTKFSTDKGNILYDQINHTWEGGKCIFCGASQKVFDRGSASEQYAYQFIHTRTPEKIFNMKFDVIIGNPPYQMSTAGSVDSQATPIYNKFVEQAIRLSPRYLSMITPARWLNGGFGLDKFRETMLNDRRIKVLHDFLDSEECFPGIDISGGVCYFLWDNNYCGDCSVYTHRNSKCSFAQRPLLEKGLETFVRQNEAISILKKVMSFNEAKFDSIVSPRDPFGLNYYVDGVEKMFKNMSPQKTKDSIGLYYFGWLKDGVQYIDPKSVTTNQSAINKYKVMISKAYGERGDYPYFVIGKPFIAPPGTCCNMTYLTIGEYEDEISAQNVASYMKTKFFRYLVNMMKNTQNAYKKVYSLVPIQDFSHSWDDEKLYKKYGLSEQEIQIIEDMIRPME